MVAAVALVVVGVGVATGLLLAYGRGTPSDASKLDAIKTAGTIVVGTGGAGALWLAARRQRTSEIALRQKELDQQQADRAYVLQERVAAETQAHQERVAAATEDDASERRITELYTKAAEQLGSEKAPVRLAGMYALERLAQTTPPQRQTIVSLLCAYLRMPYSDYGSVGEAEQRAQERQVRLTAQRILATHLRIGDDPDHPVDTFWDDIDLDLTGAVLVDFDLSQCQVRMGEFGLARFTGVARFFGTRFSGYGGFAGATFAGDAMFSLAQFGGDATFIETRFTGDARFVDAKIRGQAEFDRATFSGDALFVRARFGWDAGFEGAQFGGEARFAGTRFGRLAGFVDARFERLAAFDAVQFTGDARFERARFSGGAQFPGAKFTGAAMFENAEFAEAASFGGTRFTVPARFTDVRLRLDVPEQVERIWPAGYVVAAAGQEDHWGRLTPE